MKTHNAQFVHRSRRAEAAFTLIELLVTISIIALVLGIAGPTTMRLFSSSSDAQAYNMFSTQMALARAGAIESANFVGLHCQIATSKATGDFVANQRLSDKCMTAIVEYDTDSTATSYQRFILKKGEQPQEMPNGMAFGQIDGTYVDSGNNNYKTTVGSDLARFTTFTILFNGDGELTCNVNGNNIIFWLDSSGTSSPLFTGSSSIWDHDFTGANGTTNGSSGEPGVYAVTMFNYQTLKSKGQTYLDESGQFLVTNAYTGRLFTRE